MKKKPELFEVKYHRMFIQMIAIDYRTAQALVAEKYPCRVVQRREVEWYSTSTEKVQLKPVLM